MKKFIYEGKKLAIIKKDDDVWFRAKTIASILGYSNTKKGIFKHVWIREDKGSMNDLKNGGPNLDTSILPPAYAIWTNESGLYSLIFEI